MSKTKKAKIPATESLRTVLALLNDGLRLDVIAERMGYKDEKGVYYVLYRFDSNLKETLSLLKTKAPQEVEQILLSRITCTKTVATPNGQSGVYDKEVAAAFTLVQQRLTDIEAKIDTLMKREKTEDYIKDKRGFLSSLGAAR